MTSTLYFLPKIITIDVKKGARLRIYTHINLLKISVIWHFYIKSKIKVTFAMKVAKNEFYS
jgi:hypothetical protein